MKNILITLALWVVALAAANAQTTEEMQAMHAAKSAELAALQPVLDSVQGRVDALTSDLEDLEDKITPYPRWDIGATGTLGFNFSDYTDWLSKDSPNTTGLTLSFAGVGNVNYMQRKYFWRNSLKTTIGWQKFDDRDDPEDDGDFDVTADAFTITSLFGYKLSEKWAISALTEYRTSLLDNKLNNPGFLDVGGGMTWTPVTDLVVVVHPINYNFIFSKGPFEYKSTLGCKLFVDYKTEITKNLAWKSNLSAFASYEGIDYSNWTWTNGLTTSVKGFGLGFDFGLRGNRQEAAEHGLDNNPLQTYWIVGLSYSL